jgi:hypothetical protein
MEGVEVSALRDKHTKGYGLSGISWGSEHMCAYTAQPHMNILGVNREVGEAC